MIRRLDLYNEDLVGDKLAGVDISSRIFLLFELSIGWQINNVSVTLLRRLFDQFVNWKFK